MLCFDQVCAILSTLVIGAPGAARKLPLQILVIPVGCGDGSEASWYTDHEIIHCIAPHISCMLCVSRADDVLGRGRPHTKSWRPAPCCVLSQTAWVTIFSQHPNRAHLLVAPCKPCPKHAQHRCRHDECATLRLQRRASWGLVCRAAWGRASGTWTPTGPGPPGPGLTLSPAGGRREPVRLKTDCFDSTSTQHRL